MNKLFLLCSCFIILFYGCKKENPTEPITNQYGAGGLYLKIDRQNAPSGVETVSAYLFRENSDTLSTTVNIQTDTSALLSFTSVPAGTWLLRVDAKSNTGAVMYTGQANVIVYANQVTNVSLSLQPVQGSTGTVVIYVTWGTAPPAQWLDHLYNPVMTANNTMYEYGGVKQCQVIYDGTKYRMWYQGLVSSAGCYVLYAESNDGKAWVKMNNIQPVLSPGSMEWESGGVSPGAVMKDGEVYRMYYAGQNSSRTVWATGLAVSTDGIHWERAVSQPVLAPTPNEYPGIVCNSVLKVNGIFYLYYAVGSNPKIYVATSSDGINFQRYSGNPILVPSLSWETPGIYEPSVIYENEQFKMVYANNYDPSSCFGMATSADGFNWQKAPDNPFFRNNQSAGGWAGASVAYPCLIKAPDGYRVYYTGHSNLSMIDKIGYVRKPL